MTIDDQRLVELKRQGVRVHVESEKAKAAGDLKSAAKLKEELRELKRRIVLAECNETAS